MPDTEDILIVFNKLVLDPLIVFIFAKVSGARRVTTQISGRWVLLARLSLVANSLFVEVGGSYGIWKKHPCTLLSYGSIAPNNKWSGSGQRD